METSVIIEKLKELENLSDKYETVLSQKEDADEALLSAQNYFPNRLKSFDDKYKNEFIKNKIGEEPQELGKWNPLKLMKNKREEIERLRKEYFEKRNEAKKEYYQLNQKRRDELRKEDEADKTNRINIAMSRVKQADEDLNSIHQVWEQYKILPDKLRTTVVIKKLILFFEEGRVENIKEAINLYYEEEGKEEQERLAAEHRRKMEKAIEEQNMKIQELVQKIENIDSEVDTALNLANEAVYKADEAYSKAEEAFYK